MVRAPVFLLVLSALGSACLIGCSSKPAKTFDVSGTVTFADSPIPIGKIYFNPDFKKGNDGPQGCADIKDGKFDTRRTGHGHTGGPMVIRIEGFDGQGESPDSVGSPLFNAFEIKLELPKEASVQKLEVPASAAEGLVIPTGPGP